MPISKAYNDIIFKSYYAAAAAASTRLAAATCFSFLCQQTLSGKYVRARIKKKLHITDKNTHKYINNEKINIIGDRNNCKTVYSAGYTCGLEEFA